MQHPKRLIVVLCLIAAGLYISQHTNTSDATEAKPSANLLRVTTATPTSKHLQQTLRISGLVVPREDVVVTTELSQVRITNVLVDEGAYVERNQHLATLDPASLGNQHKELQANFAQAEQEYQRAFTIRNSGAITKESLDQKHAAYKALKAQLDDAALKLGRAKITAPTAGLLYDRQANIGNLVSSTQPLFRIAKEGELELEAEIAEADLPHIKLGQAARVILQGQKDAILGTIRVISPHINTQSRTAHIRITMPNAASIAVGAFGHAEIITADITTLALPQTAIMQDEKTYVWHVQSNGTVKRLPVTLGVQADGWIAVTSDNITPTMPIVAKAGVFLNEGDKVIIIPDQKTDAATQEETKP